MRRLLLVAALLGLAALGVGVALLYAGGAPDQAAEPAAPPLPDWAWQVPESGPLECPGWPAPSNPPPFLDRPEQGRLDSQLRLLGLEGDCAPRDAGQGTTGYDCDYAGRGLHVAGQLLYNAEGAGRVHVGREAPGRVWVSAHPTWGGYLDVIELGCAVRLRELLASRSELQLASMAQALREAGWEVACEGADPQGRTSCTLRRGDLVGELVFLARPEGARPAAEARLEDGGEARWVGPTGVASLRVARATSTEIVIESVFPELSEEAP